MQEIRIKLSTSPHKSLEIVGPAEITTQTTDAIVNAANSTLLGGGGVDGAIHRAGVPEILEQCKAHVAKNGRLSPGEAMLTSGGRLAAKYVIHTVGPVYHGGGYREREVLESCYRESIRLADEQAITSLAFPAISTGAYGYPLHEAAEVAIASATAALQQAKNVQRVRFVLFDSAAVKAHLRAAKQLTKTRPEFLLEGDELGSE